MYSPVVFHVYWAEFFFKKEYNVHMGCNINQDMAHTTVIWDSLMGMEHLQLQQLCN